MITHVITLIMRTLWLWSIGCGTLVASDCLNEAGQEVVWIVVPQHDLSGRLVAVLKIGFRAQSSGFRVEEAPVCSKPQLGPTFVLAAAEAALPCPKARNPQINFFRYMGGSEIPLLGLPITRLYPV